MIADSRYDLTIDQLATLLEDQPAYRVRQVWDGLYQRLLAPTEMTDLPKALRERLDREAPPALAAALHLTSASGDTDKILWRLHDETTVETVLMRYDDRVTVCVSTQVGCAMACGFCATGQAGFDRHLTTGEIVEQVVAAARIAQPRRLSNVVFMGMGEPLANFTHVVAALHRLRDDLGLSARHLTVSTVGIIPGIRRLAAEQLPLSLAVSLHAANDRLRNELVPINRRYPLAALSQACAEYREATGRRISLEWAMIAGTNDSDRDAQELARFTRPLRAHVNLIPLNPTPGWPTTASPRRRVREFRDLLDAAGVNATIRANRGVDIDAACGQLRARHANTASVTLKRRCDVSPEAG